MVNWHALVVALTLLTRLPLPARWQPPQFNPELQSRAALFYPVVGAAIGGLILLLYLVLPDKIGVTAQATLLVGLWVWLTGAMHLDGLADTTDALAAAHKDPTRIHAVLKDPHLGTMGVCALVMVLLLKLALLRTVLETGSFYWALLAAPIGARLLAQIYMLTTPYARAEGMASDIDLRPYQAIVIGLALIELVITMWVMGRLAGTALIVALALWLVHWQGRWWRLVGGYTGDSVGALIEVAEVLILLLIVLSW
jgi:adenosylcobinamide-GDP ribazoletransferase